MHTKNEQMLKDILEHNEKDLIYNKLFAISKILIEKTGELDDSVSELKE
jgi:hypothetical protein